MTSPRRAGVGAAVAASYLCACAPPPTPAPDAVACPAGQVVDGDGCVPEACGTGTWGGRTADVYVDAAAPEGGDGSAERPYRAIGAALGEGATVAVAAGRYGPLDLGATASGVSLRGRCAELVHLDAGGAARAAVQVDGAGGVELAGLTVTGGGTAGVSVQAGTVVLRDARVVDNAGFGVLVVGEGAEVGLVATVVDGVAPLGDTFGYGISVGAGGRATVEASRIQAATRAGVAAADGGGVRIVASEIRDTRPQSDGATANGLWALSGGWVEVEDVVVAGSVGVGAEVYREGRLDGVGLVLEDTTPDPTGNGGWALEVHAAEAELVGLELRGSTTTAALVDARASLVAREVRVEDVGRGTVYTGAAGLVVQGDSVAALEDVGVQGVDGPGVVVIDAQLSVSGGAIADVGFAGLVSVGSRLDLRDTVITGVTEDPGLGGGVGVAIFDHVGPGEETLDGVVLAASPLAALWVHGDARLSVTGSTLRGGAGRALAEGVWVHGNAVYARDVVDPTALQVRDSLLADAAVAVLLDGATGTLTGDDWTGDVEAIVRQRCDDVPAPVADVPVTDRCAGPDLLTVDLDYTVTFHDRVADE